MAFASHPLEVDDTASGHLDQRVYASPRFGAVSLLVYTPPGYYQNADTVYPTIYWLHGSGDNHLQLLDALNELPGTGSAVERLDALISSEQLPPLMLVSAASPLINAKWEDSLLDLVTDELPDFIDANFASDPRRAGRGIEGFSQGSEGVSRYVTFRPDRFATASLLGGGFLVSRWTAQAGEILRDKLEVYLLTGADDVEFLSNAQALDTELTNIGIPHSFVTPAGVPHNIAQLYQSGGLANLQWHAARWADAGLVDAGPDQDLDTAMPIDVGLTGAIDDPDGDLGAFTLLWEQVSGPGVASFDDDTILTPTVTLPTAGTYHFELTATGTGTACDVVRVTAIDSTDALALYLPFDDGTGADVSGQGRNGIVAGSPASEPDGQRNSALSFDGVDDSVTVSDFSYGPNFSLSLWVQPTDLIGTAYQYFVSHGLFDVVSSLNFYFVEDGATLRHGPAAEEHEAARTSPLAAVFDDSFDAASARLARGVEAKDGFDPPGAPRGASPRLRFGIRDGAGDPSLAQTQVPAIEFVDGEWHHLAVVVGPKPTYGHQIWIDGVAVAQCIDDGNALTDECETGGDAIDPTTDLVFGGRSDFDSSRYYLGGLDEVRFYDRALLPEEIELLAEEATNAPPTVAAGDDRTVYGPSGVVLAGSVVDDGPPTDLVIGWSQIVGPGTASFVDDGSPQTGVTFSLPGVYTLRLTAADPVARATVSDDVTLTVLAEQVPDLVGYWPMDQGSGTAVPDDSGLEHDGVATAPGWLTGLSGFAVSLNGSDAVVVDTSVLLDLDPATDDLSLSAWIRVAAGEVGTILGKGAAGSAQYRLYLDDPGVDGRSDLYGEIGGAVNATADGVGDRIDDGEWHHVALVHDAGTGMQQLYIDGVAVGSAVAAGTMTSPDAVHLGSDLAGDVDDVRIYQRALDTAGVESSRAPIDCVAPGCEPLFSDDFETGGTSEWTAVQGL